ncbi:MAG: hypothetical protein LBS16_06080, partial [Prevotellaceae bacterium]|nr:hypothetical protein [Prevotellaceae bacterium]
GSRGDFFRKLRYRLYAVMKILPCRQSGKPFFCPLGRYVNIRKCNLRTSQYAEHQPVWVELSFSSTLRVEVGCVSLLSVSYTYGYSHFVLADSLGSRFSIDI